MTAEESRYIEQVANRESGRLLNFIQRRVGNREDAEDILQDVLYQFTRGFADIRSTGRISSWLFTVARNRITDYFRKKKPVPMSEKEFSGSDEDGSPLMLEEILPSLSEGPEYEMMREWIWSAVEQALDEMPPEQRDVFVWNEFEDRSFKEISSMTGDGINTLLSRKRYAILYLRRNLQELYDQL